MVIKWHKFPYLTNPLFGRKEWVSEREGERDRANENFLTSIWFVLKWCDRVSMQVPNRNHAWQSLDAIQIIFEFTNCNCACHLITVVVVGTSIPQMLDEQLSLTYSNAKFHHIDKRYALLLLFIIDRYVYTRLCIERYFIAHVVISFFVFKRPFRKNGDIYKLRIFCAKNE